MTLESKVVPLGIIPETTPADRAGYEECWRELVATKARLADALNQVAAQNREIEDLRRYVKRQVKRLDAVASRLERS